jgi:DNA-binding Lrp family transcriptional regulator
MKELLPFSEVAKMYGVSESTFRRRLKKLDKKSINELTKYVNGKVFIVVNKLSLYEKIENIEILPFNDEIDIKDSSESENLWKQNEKLLNTISEKDNEIRNLTSMVMKLQNDINGYIKQIGEGSREPGNNIADIIIKIALAIVLVVLVWYLVFS